VPQERIVIVGAGPAGCAAAVQCERLGIRPLLLDESGAAGGLAVNAFRIENYPATGGPVSGPELARRLGAWLDTFSLRVERARVDHIAGPEPSGARAGFVLSGPEGEVRCRSLILATGTLPVAAGIPGEEELAGRLLFYEVRPALRLLNMLAVTGEHECKRQDAKCKVQDGQASRLSATIRLRTRLRLDFGDHPPSHEASAGLRRPSAFARGFGGTSATTTHDRRPTRFCLDLDAPTACSSSSSPPAPSIPVRARCLVIGGGEAALDSSLSLAAAGAEVRLCLRGGGPKACARLVRMVGEERRLALSVNTTVADLRGAGGGIEAQLSGPAGGEIVAVDLVVVAVGRRSRVPRISGLTSPPGLYIAGDARLGSLGQVGIAVGDGLRSAAEAVRFLAEGG
jgi:thioredoxin reductase